MNKLSSLTQIRMYKPVILKPTTHKQLAQKLKFFTPDLFYQRLSYTHWFQQQRYPSVLEKMRRIGWLADQICHHPEWKLTKKCLEIAISTHDIDYILAEFIEQVLEGKDIEKHLFDQWNKKQVSVSQLLAKNDQSQL